MDTCRFLPCRLLSIKVEDTTLLFILFYLYIETANVTYKNIFFIKQTLQYGRLPENE